MKGVFDYRLPIPALREHIRRIKVVGCQFGGQLPPPKAYWPRAELCLNFYPKDLEQVEYGFGKKPLQNVRSALFGPQSIITNRYVRNDFLLLQVQFQPGGLARLFGVPLGELTNRFIDAETVFSAEVRAVNERLSYAKDYLLRFNQ
jgi:hypothetical protein